MLAADRVEEVLRLLADNTLSHRQIAERAGVSRGSVKSIADGRRPDYAARRQLRQQEAEPLVEGPVGRCPRCGALCYLPCRGCLLKGLPRTVGWMAMFAESPLGLDLREPHRARYEQVHRRHIAAELAEAEAGLSAGRTVEP